VTVHAPALIVMDIHAHSSELEIIGILAGSQNLFAELTRPTDSNQVATTANATL
jgi:hypothetical protein